MKLIKRSLLTACSLLVAATLTDVAATLTDTDSLLLTTIVVEPAEALPARRVARRTARRTSRRVIRRSTIYAASLPAGCSPVVIEGASLYSCGSTYYQPYGNQYEVVYID